MTNRNLFVAHAVIYAIFALALFFLADTMWPFYGVTISDKYALFLSQHTSIFLGGVAALAWVHRDADAIAARNTLKGLLITNLLGVVITLYAGFTGIFTGMGWSDPIFFACLAALVAFKLSRD